MESLGNLRLFQCGDGQSLPEAMETMRKRTLPAAMSLEDQLVMKPTRGGANEMCWQPALTRDYWRGIERESFAIA
jgi:hypothetical protein